MKKHPARPRLLGLLGAVGATVVLAGCAGHGGTSGAHGGSAPSTADASYGPAAAGAHNAQDVTFATDMIPHHAQAVEMSDLALSRSTDADVKALASQIKAAQAPEISQMGGWLLGWGATVPAGASGHASGMSHGDGMMSSDEMAELDAASGTSFAKLFLTGMTKHHQGAVDMARTELASGQNAEAKALASRIVAAQNEEIATMAGLLAKLGG